jgi:hypothetical protein
VISIETVTHESAREMQPTGADGPTVFALALPAASPSPATENARAIAQRPRVVRDFRVMGISPESECRMQAGGVSE